MKLWLYLFFYCLIGSAYAEDELAGSPAALGEPSYALASLEGDPNTIIYQAVNVITGDYVDYQMDLVIPGVEPLTLERFYCSSNPPSLNLFKAWHFNHLIEIEQIEDSREFHLHGGLGSNIPFEKKSANQEEIHLKVKPECLNKRVTNTPRGVLSGRTLLKNQNMKFKNKEGVLKDGSGTAYFFDKPSEGRTKGVHRIEKSNRNRILYEDEHYRFDRSGQHYPKTITAVNNQGTLLNRLSLVLQTNKGQKSLVAYHKKKKLATFTYEPVAYYWFDKEPGEIAWVKDWQWILKEVKREEGPPETYHYTHLRRHYPEPKKLIRKERPDGRFLEIEYYRKGDNWVWPGYNCSVEGRRIGRVMHLKAPAGPSGETIPIYRFLYDPGKKTEVYDAQDRRKIYHLNEDERLSKIETFQGPHVYCEERFEWDKKGNLRSKTFITGTETVYYNVYTYDLFGNLFDEHLEGNLTGRGGSLYVGHRYNDEHLLSYENSADKPHDFSYRYHQGTDLLEARFTIEGEKVKIREFFFYDDNSALCQEIIDDGCESAFDNLKDVTERRIRYIQNTTAFPIGLPKIVEEKYLDLTSNQECLLKRWENRYDDQGHLIEQKHFDSQGRYLYTLTWKYERGNVVEETNALGYVTTRSYDANGNLQVEQTARLKKTFSTDFMNRIISEAQSGKDGEFSKSYRYDTLGNKVAEIDINGHETRYVYDTFNRPIEIHHPPVQNEHGEICHPKTIKTYDALGHVTSIIDPQGNITQAKYTIKGKPYYIRHPDDTEEHFEYTPKGQLIKKIERNGSYILYEYDYLARPIKKEVFTSSGERLTIETKTYDAFHLRTETDAEGIATRYFYDGAGRLTSKRKGPRRTDYFYDAQGFIGETREYCDKHHYFATYRTYDFLGRALEETTMQDAVISRHTSYTYDENGNCTCTRQHHENGIAASYVEYNDFDQPSKITDPLGKITRIDYIYGKHPCTITTDPKGNQIEQVYDALGREIETIYKTPFELLKKTLSIYDLNGNCCHTVEVLKDREVHTLKSYNAMQQLTLLQEAFGEPEQKATRYDYNAYGQLETITKPDGRKIQHVYNPLGLLSEFQGSDFHYVYTYNALGQPTRIEDKVQGTITIKNYLLGRLHSEILGNKLTVSYRYDALDRPIRIILPDATEIHYTYQGLYLIEVKRKDKTYPHKHNQLGHLIFASAQASTYDVLGAPLNIHSPHFQENIVGRDPLHQLLHRTVEDPVGKFECHYHYDELSQLIEETAPYPHTYVNDPLYNQVVKDGFLQSHNALNQLLKSSQSYYTYDLNGNRLSDKSRSYEYDALDRLIRIRQQDMHVSYTYDENNRRLSKTVTQQDQSETTYYFYSGTQELGTYKDGQMIELKIPGEKSAVAFEIQQTTYLPTYDHLGNVCCLHSPPGELVETYRHSAFGEEQIFDADNHPSDSINPWRYQGQRHDPESNLIYFGLRFYDPSTAKWLTPDPIGQEGGPNLYAYVLNNPLRYFDRLGLSPEEDTWMDYEIDRLSHYFLERDREQGIKRKDVAHALCGSCHGSLDFALGTLHDWHTFFAHLGAGELDFEERTQILGEIQRSQANQMARVEGWVAHQFSVDPSDPVYQSFRSSTRIGLEVGTLVAGGYGAVQGITKVTRITRLPSAIAKTSFQTVIKGSRNRFTPNFHASGAHTVFRKDPIMGNITHYETFRLQTNPFDPKPWESVLRYDGLSDVESRHYNKILKRYIDTPHVHDPLCPGGIRPAREWEIPK